VQSDRCERRPGQHPPSRPALTARQCPAAGLPRGRDLHRLPGPRETATVLAGVGAPRFKARCNAYRADDGGDDGKCCHAAASTCSVRFLDRHGSCSMSLEKGEENHGNHPHRPCRALPVWRRRLLLDPPARVVPGTGFTSWAGALSQGSEPIESTSTTERVGSRAIGERDSP